MAVSEAVGHDRRGNPLYKKDASGMNLLDDNGNYPLMIAISLDSLDFVKSLLNSNKVNLTQEVIKKRSFMRDDLNLTEKTKTTYLNLATECKKSEIFTLLLDANDIDINAVDEHGNTHLINASRNLKVDVVNLLFTKENLDYLHCNNDGDDALKIVEKMRNNQKQFFIKSRANHMNIDNISPEKRAYLEKLINLCNF